MPDLTLNGTRIHYETRGAGPQTLVFAHGLLMSGRMFDAQVAALSERYRCIAFDFRGQGRSEVTRGGYDMDTLAGDAAALIEALDAAPCHFVGLSMGGFVGMRIALERPELLRSLTLIGTSADPEPPENVPRYRRLRLIARWLGLGLVRKPVMGLLFGKNFLADPARAALRREMERRLVANHRVGITRAARGVIDRDGLRHRLGDVETPTLILVGDQDVATPPEQARRIRQVIEHARLAMIIDAGHSASIEEPAAVTQAITDFLDDLAEEALEASDAGRRLREVSRSSDDG